MSNWKKTEDELPPEGKWVIGRHNRGTWIDREDQENVNVVVVKLVKGISLEERKVLEAKGDPRARTIRNADQHSNNKKPYYWNEFGPDSFFGQDIIEWCFIPE